MGTSERILETVERALPWLRWTPGHSWGWTWADLGRSVTEAWPLHVRHLPGGAAPPVPRQRSARSSSRVGA